MSNLTLLDVTKLNGNDAEIGLIEENLRYAPELEVIPTRTPIKGTSYTTGIRVGLPSVGFRGVNEGQTPSKSRFEKRLIECFIFGGPIEVDQALADAYDGGAAALQSIEASGIAKAALQALGSQVWYGTVKDSKGFPGIKAATPFGGKTAAGDNLTINAGGTTANTASSVYAVKFGPQDVQFVPGNGTTIAVGDWITQQIVASNGGKLMAYVNAINAWIGLQIGNENCVRRIANITADSGKGLTDSLLADLLATFPVGQTPDAIFMSRRSRKQLQNSRTVVLNGSGKTRPDQPTVAPAPTEYEGIKIITTDSILNTDALES